MARSMDEMGQTPVTGHDDSLPRGWAAGPGMRHGGMLSQARVLFPQAPLPFIDLSTGINPHAYPLGPLPDDAFTRLPDEADEAALRDVAAQAYGVSDPAMVVAAPGTQILIGLLPHLLARPTSVAILSPTYGEHEAAWARAGYAVRPVSRFEDLLASDIAVICNPNNPDGCRTDPASLLGLADAMAQRGGFLAVDEAFADLEPPGISMAGALPHPALVILRSFGKTYGLAGLRLGFALTAPDRAARLRAALGPWAVSGPALVAGLRGLADPSWRHAMIARLDRDTQRLDAMVALHGLSLVGGTRLFRLYESPAATALHQHLGAAGILVRRFAGQPKRLRFGLPVDEACWARLATVLKTADSSLDR